MVAEGNHCWKTICQLIEIRQYTHHFFSHNFIHHHKVTITQTYKNVESQPIEALYKFPIHEAAAICEFEAVIDDNRLVKGVVKEAQQAAKEYKEAVQVRIK
jgi:hypothetical protein